MFVITSYVKNIIDQETYINFIVTLPLSFEPCSIPRKIRGRIRKLVKKLRQETLVGAIFFFALKSFPTR